MKLAVLGCGNMGSAIITGIEKKYDWSIVAYDLNKALIDQFENVTYEDPQEWFNAEEPDMVLLAVKPQIMEKALRCFTSAGKETLWVSIAAGVSLDSLKNMLPADANICRVMPNTPAVIGEAMSGYSLSDNCTDANEENVKNMLGAIGKFIKVPEYQMDAVIGVSGSGPAYIFTVIEALTEGGVVAGLPYAQAQECAVQTLIGAARLVQESGEAPAVLRSQVMSPGGTTAAAVKALEEGGLRAALMNAVTSAAKRSAELG